MLAICFLFFSLFLERSLSALLVLSKHQLFVSLTLLFSCVRVFYFHCFLLNLYYSLYAACFGISLLFFCSFLEVELRLLIYNFSSFLLCAFRAINFAVSTAVAVPQILICCIFIFIQLILFFISSETSSLPRLFGSVLLSFQVWGDFPVTDF